MDYKRGRLAFTIQAQEARLQRLRLRHTGDHAVIERAEDMLRHYRQQSEVLGKISSPEDPVLRHDGAEAVPGSEIVNGEGVLTVRLLRPLPTPICYQMRLPPRQTVVSVMSETTVRSGYRSCEILIPILAPPAKTTEHKDEAKESEGSAITTTSKSGLGVEFSQSDVTGTGMTILLFGTTKTTAGTTSGIK